MRTAICIPYFGGRHYLHLKAVEELRKELPNACGFQTEGMPYICLARNMLARMAMDEAAIEPDVSKRVDRVLWIDHDIVFDPKDAVRMLESLDREHPIIGGAYSMKKPGRGIIGSFDTAQPENQRISFFKNGGLHPAEPKTGIGMGFAAVLLSVYEDLAKDMIACPVPETPCNPVYPFYALETSAEGYFGEDFSFCRRAHRKGHRTFIDTRPRLLHYGGYAYKIEDASSIVPIHDELVVVSGAKTELREQPANVVRDKQGLPVGVDGAVKNVPAHANVVAAHG